MKYIIIRDQWEEKFEDKVNNKLDNGFNLYWSPQVLTAWPNNYIYIFKYTSFQVVTLKPFISSAFCWE